MKENAPSLNLCAVSLDIAFADVQKNLEAASEIISSIGNDFDIIVLPELFSTSFIADKELLAKVAEDDDGPTISALKQLSSSFDCMIAGSYAAVRDGCFYNRGFMLCPDGKAAFYDKRHLFSVSAEADIFTAGRHEMPVVDFRGWNVSMIICYDLRFPVWSRNVDHRYDILLVPANWPHSRAYAWTHLLIARAIENQSVVIGANRGGEDEYGQYDNLSQIFDGVGRPIGYPFDCGRMVTAKVNASDLVVSRRRLPAHFDADDFTIPL